MPNATDSNQQPAPPQTPVSPPGRGPKPDDNDKPPQKSKISRGSCSGDALVFRRRRLSS